MNVDCTMAVDWYIRKARLLPKGKQYSYVAWYRVRKGPSDDEYEVSLPLVSTFSLSESTNSHLLMVQNCSLAHLISAHMVQNCSLARERVKYFGMHEQAHG